VLATAGMHVGIAVFMGLGVFGAILIVFAVAAFAVSAEPRASSRRVAARVDTVC
jgi:hypothetical protein